LKVFSFAMAKETKKKKIFGVELQHNEKNDTPRVLEGAMKKYEGISDETA
jgi:hypothetical protein